jgi:UDP-N-acetylglucosamine---dolichyl-phosphate N-acetylglucosaminyltransferase
MKKIFVVIPSRNEKGRVENVVKSVKLEGFKNIIVVDDGSTDGSGELAEKEGAIVLRHPINLGAGAATQTGIAFALLQEADIIVTIDGDMQHYPSDINSLIQEMNLKNLDLVIGSRFLKDNSGIPPDRRLVNFLANIFSGIITGIFVSDSQSGMKAISSNFASKLQFTFDGYEFCTEILKIAHQNKVKYGEVPIAVHYDKELLNKGQSWRNVGNMVFRLIKYFT